MSVPESVGPVAKTRLNRKEVRRLKRKESYAVATRVRFLVGQLPNQAALDTCLLQEPDIEKRQKLFEFMKPFLKFHNPELPSNLRVNSQIIRP